jgi:hypothetical protein
MKIQEAIKRGDTPEQITDYKIINAAAEAVLKQSNLFELINKAADNINTPTMPYKAQAILETVIEKLQERV